MNNIFVKMLERTPTYSHHCGAVCRFVQLSKKWGVKLYRHEKVRNACFDRQFRANRHNLGPIARKPFKKKLWNIQWFGFITEIAITIDESGKCNDKNQLQRDLLKIGIDNGDLHPYNMGHLPNGNLVCIDFSHCAPDSDEYGNMNIIDENWRHNREDSGGRRIDIDKYQSVT